MCSVCMDHVPQSAMFTLRCAHSYCHGCLHQYFAHEVREGRTALRCPDCKATPTEPEISQVLGPELTERYLFLGLNRWLTQHPHARRCVGVNCDNAVIIGDLDPPTGRRGLIGQLLSRAKPPCAVRPRAPLVWSAAYAGPRSSKDVASRWECTRPGCGAEVCLRCGHAWHPAMSCEEVMALEDIGLTEDVIGGERGEVRPCPNCKSPIFKIEDGSCNHMICEACHKHFCWLCMKEVNDFHFLTPSGCTYFARQRWSLSKKVCQRVHLGTPHRPHVLIVPP